jgi:hypothetical protein
MVKLRDWAAGLLLFFATAAVIFWQGTHRVVLWDLSYVLDTAARIASGQMPYRDFPLVHTPGTFLVQAALMQLTGRVFLHSVIYISLIGGLSSVLAWRIALRILGGARLPALLVSLPLVVLGIYCILPQPSYDCDTIFWVLVALWAWQHIEAPKAGFWRGIWVGIAIAMPLSFKQNIGLPFLAVAVIAALVVMTQRGWRTGQTRALRGLLCGVAATLIAAVLVLHFTAGIGNLLHWTITFAGQRRMPGLAAMFSVYADPQLLWTLPCIFVGGWLAGRSRQWLRVAGILLAAAPFLWTLGELARSNDADDRASALLALWPMILIAATVVAVLRLIRARTSLDGAAFLPLLVLAAVQGTLMSQQLWGSTYAIFPLLMLLAAGLLAAMPGPGWARASIAGVFSVTLLVSGGLYIASAERLSYAQFPSGPPVRSGFGALAGMATPGPFVPDLDELLAYAQAHIPAGDGLILLPGEDPFYFVTGRAPQFPVLLFDPSTDPYSSAEAAAEARRRNIRWLVVKRRLQITESPAPDGTALEVTLERDFHIEAHLGGYDVYRR